ncbi:hypothetical protein MMC30_005222 [Trapelia coarctata]|nr:hypothetical protein [Trapelia coarctata]
MSASSKQLVRITYTSPGIQPPVFVAGAFTDPPWQPCEMEHVRPASYPSTDLEGKAVYSFFKEFNVTEGRWQYKFRLGPGDWWACDETAEIVTDDAGNRNNLLVISPNHADHPHMEKYAHARPFHRSDESSHNTAWEVFETDVEPQNASAGKHQKHSLNKGHSKPHSSREDSDEVVEDVQSHQTPAVPLPGGTAVARHSPLVHSKASVEASVDDVPANSSPEPSANILPEGISETRHSPAAADSTAASRSPQLSALGLQDKSPVLIITEADTESPALGINGNLESNPDVPVPSIAADTKAHDRKLSNIDIEQVKLIMFLTTPTGTSPTTMAAQDGNILGIDADEPDYSSARISPGLERNLHSHAPLLPHECLTCAPESSPSDAGNDEVQSRKQSYSSDDHNGDTEDPPTPDDFDSPHLERFPSGAKDILQRIATLQKEIPPDEAIVFEDDYLHRSPSFVTREAPTFPHEMPPIGSPAAMRRKASSMESPQFPGDTDGSADTRPHSESAHSPYLLPPSSVPLYFKRVDSRDSIHSSVSDMRGLADNDEQPLLDTGSEPANPAEAAVHAAPSPSHTEPSFLKSEGARLRNAKTADLISSTEDSSSAASTSEAATKSWWQRVLNWVSTLFENLFGVRRTE